MGELWGVLGKVQVLLGGLGFTVECDVWGQRSGLSMSGCEREERCFWSM